MTVTAKCLIESKFAANATTTEYTAPASTRTIIDKFSVSNQDVSTRTIDIYIVPSGSSAGSSNKVVSAFSMIAGVSQELSEMKNQILNAGDFIAIQASSASAVVIRASGREVA